VNIAPPLTPAMKAARDNVPVDLLSRPEEAGPILDRLTKNRIDLVKVVLSPSPNFSEFLPALAELSRQSHARGYRVATHAMQLEVAKAAVRTGTDILAHTVVDLPVDDEFIALARDRGAVNISTAGFIGGAARLLQHPFALEDTEKTCGDADIEAAWRQWDSVPESERPPMDQRLLRAGDIKRVVLGNLKRLYAAGIPIATGSDAGTVGNQHGPSLQRELRLLTEAGLPPMDVILAATRNAARALAFEKELGTIEPGKFADLVILSADPLQDTNNLDRITHVMIRGEMIARQTLQSQLAKRSQVRDTLVRSQK
jgi:imidazolonepropionase-like amidohydrolase